MEAARNETRQAFLDAAERLLISHGYAEITTRRVSEEAGANHGLVHYYFGSMEELFVQVLERFTERILRRQRALYASDEPFLKKWRQAMNYIDEDLAAGFPKVLFELEAMAWNRPELQSRITKIHAEFRAMLGEAVGVAMKGYRIDARRFPPGALTALVQTFNIGLLIERLAGFREGHDELLRMIDRWLQSLERK